MNCVHQQRHIKSECLQPAPPVGTDVLEGVSYESIKGPYLSDNRDPGPSCIYLTLWQRSEYLG